MGLHKERHLRSWALPGLIFGRWGVAASKQSCGHRRKATFGLGIEPFYRPRFGIGRGYKGSPAQGASTFCCVVLVHFWPSKGLAFDFQLPRATTQGRSLPGGSATSGLPATRRQLRRLRRVICFLALLCWFVGVLVCWCVGLLICWFVGLLA